MEESARNDAPAHEESQVILALEEEDMREDIPWKIRYSRHRVQIEYLGEISAPTGSACAGGGRMH